MKWEKVGSFKVQESFGYVPTLENAESCVTGFGNFMVADMIMVGIDGSKRSLGSQAYLVAHPSLAPIYISLNLKDIEEAKKSAQQEYNQRLLSVKSAVENLDIELDKLEDKENGIEELIEEPTENDKQNPEGA